MDKITQALKDILPAEQVSEVAKAVEEMISEQVEAIEAEAQQKLEEAYEQLAEETKAAEQVAEAGYQQAYEIISNLMTRLDEQREEFETALEEGFEEAYAELQKEKAKNESIEVELYEEFDRKLNDMKELMIDKIDQFLGLQESEIYESAKRDVLNDPSILEQRVAVEKMAEILADYMSQDDYAGVASSKLEETTRAVEELKGQLRIVEARNVRLSAQNSKLNEQVTEAKGLLTEAAKVERKERVAKKVNASGRGQRVVNESIINEFVQPTAANTNQRDLNEGHNELDDLLVLSGLQES